MALFGNLLFVFAFAFGLSFILFISFIIFILFLSFLSLIPHCYFKKSTAGDKAAR